MKSTKAEQKKILDDLGEIYLDNNAIAFWKDLFVVPNGLFLQVPFHMIRKNGEYLFEKTNMHYWPSLKIASTEYKKRKSKINKISVFYNSVERMSDKEAKKIESIFKKSHTNLIKDPSLEEFRMYSSDADHIHIVTHFDGLYVKFNRCEYTMKEITDNMAVEGKSILLHICMGGTVRNSTAYPVSHDSLSHLLAGKGAASVIGHFWYLPQQTSIKFSETYYKSASRGKPADRRFREALLAVKHKNPSNYGGYMVWGH